MQVVAIDFEPSVFNDILVRIIIIFSQYNNKFMFIQMTQFKNETKKIVDSNRPYIKRFIENTSW